MTRGMVVAPQPEAVEAGAIALKRGGNAVDAAVTCALVETVVDPCMAGLAGFGTAVLHLPAAGYQGCLDFHTRAPAAVREDMWADRVVGEARDGFGFFLEGRANEVGYQSVMTPGSLLAFEQMLERHGTFEWRDAVGPAIDLARSGFAVRPQMYEYWTRTSDHGRLPTMDKLSFSATGRQVYFDDSGALLRPGAWLDNPDMVRSLERVAAGGAEVFYRGDLAEEMAADIAAHGGLLSLADLSGYGTQETTPLRTTYRGLEVVSCQPPGGGLALLELLNILEHFDLAGLGHNTAAYLRVAGEAMKRVTADKDAHVGDPEFMAVPVERLISKAYAAECADSIRRGERAGIARLPEPDAATDTTHVSVLDEHGNAVSLTHSLGMPSGVITDGLGFMYNGCMAVFDPRPGRPGSLAPGKRRYTAMAPTLVLDGDRLVMVIGAPGGAWITTGVAQAIVNVVDFRMSMQEAVSAPRFTANSDVVDVSNRIPRYVTDALEAEGYAVARSHGSYVFAGVHGIRVLDGRWQGGADPGRDGMALEV